MTQPHEWPGEWSKTAPQVADHPPGAELVWAVRGEPFTRPILARSNVGARIQRFASKGERFVYVELMAEGFHGVHAGHYGFFDELEWRGPLVLPSAMHTASTDQDMKGCVMKWLKSKLCDWFHGGRIKRDAQGRINWQCDTCGRWGTPVSRESERRMVDRDLAEYAAAQEPTP